MFIAASASERHPATTAEGVGRVVTGGAVMGQHAFKNRLRSLFNIDGYLLSELTGDQQRAFVCNPVRYYLNTDKAQSEAVWREVERRQGK